MSKFWFWLSDCQLPLVRTTSTPIRKSWWVVCCTLLFQAPSPSVIANQCTNWQGGWKWTLCRKDWYMVTGDQRSDPQWLGADMIWWSKFKPLQWMANGQYVAWMKANETAQWRSQQPRPSSGQEGTCVRWLFLEFQRGKIKSHYPDGEKKHVS